MKCCNMTVKVREYGNGGGAKTNKQLIFGNPVGKYFAPLSSWAGKRVNRRVLLRREMHLY